MTPAERFDVVILGSGSAGEACADELVACGRTVAVVEGNRVGGECKYVACIPAKAMLRSAQARVEGGPAALGGLHDADEAYAVAVRRRDELSHQRDDTDAATELRDSGVELVRGRGRVVEPGVVAVGDRRLAYGHLVVATGSRPLRPPLEGLDRVPTWTSDESLSTLDRPASLLILGGGPVGCESAQTFARFGVRVVLVDPAEELLGGKEESSVAALLRAVLERDGVHVRLGVKAASAEPCPEGARVQLDDGTVVEVERVLLAAGRTPNADDLGLELLGIELGERGELAVDDHCRVPGTGSVWAAGDVTGDAPYTHTATYRGRIVAANILGGDRTADLRAVPRAVYTYPAVASVGLDAAAASTQGIDAIDAITACTDLDTVPRTNTEGEGSGRLVLTADRAAGVLIGAAAIGPHADDWLGEAVLAIRARIPLSVLADTIHAFPTYGEAFEPAVRELAGRVEGRQS